METKRLPDAELEVMKVLWQIGAPAGRADIEQRLRDTQNWAATTILSMLSRLEAKGFVRIRKEGRNNLYCPAVSREEYMRMESRTVLDRVFGGSPKAFMAALVQGDSLSAGDIEELEDYLQAVRDGGEP